MKKPEAIVVGAGFSGLVSAYFLSEAGWLVRVFEQSNRVGGLISTEMTPNGPAESAAHGIVNSVLLEKVCKDIGVEVIPKSREARRRFVYRQEFRRWPLDFLESRRLLFNFLPRYWLLRYSVRPQPVETVEHWGKRVLGSEATQFLLGPALRGVYASDVNSLSAHLVINSLLRRSKAWSARPKVRGMVSFRKGMGEFTERMHAFLLEKGVDFRLQTPFEWKLRPGIHVPVVVCTSAFHARQILEPENPTLAQVLSRIDMLPLVSVTLFFEKTSRDPEAFGCVFPRSEGFSVLGILFNDAIFPDRGPHRSETWIFGGSQSREVCEWSDEFILSKVQVERMKIFGTRGKLFGHKIFRWPQALPNYTIEVESMQPDLHSVQNNVHLVGNYMGQIGLSGILEQAKTTTEKIVPVVME